MDKLANISLNYNQNNPTTRLANNAANTMFRARPSRSPSRSPARSATSSRTSVKQPATKPINKQFGQHAYNMTNFDSSMTKNDFDLGVERIRELGQQYGIAPARVEATIQKAKQRYNRFNSSATSGASSVTPVAPTARPSYPVNSAQEPMPTPRQTAMAPQKAVSSFSPSMGRTQQPATSRQPASRPQTNDTGVYGPVMGGPMLDYSANQSAQIGNNRTYINPDGSNSSFNLDDVRNKVAPRRTPATPTVSTVADSNSAAPNTQASQPEPFVPIFNPAIQGQPQPRVRRQLPGTPPITQTPKRTVASNTNARAGAVSSPSMNSEALSYTRDNGYGFKPTDFGGLDTAFNTEKDRLGTIMQGVGPTQREAAQKVYDRRMSRLQGAYDAARNNLREQQMGVANAGMSRSISPKPVQQSQSSMLSSEAIPLTAPINVSNSGTAAVGAQASSNSIIPDSWAAPTSNPTRMPKPVPVSANNGNYVQKLKQEAQAPTSQTRAPLANPVVRRKGAVQQPTTDFGRGVQEKTTNFLNSAQNTMADVIHDWSLPMAYTSVAPIEYISPTFGNLCNTAIGKAGRQLTSGDALLKAKKENAATAAYVGRTADSLYNAASSAGTVINNAGGDVVAGVGKSILNPNTKPYSASQGSELNANEWGNAVQRGVGDVWSSAARAAKSSIVEPVRNAGSFVSGLFGKSSSYQEMPTHLKPRDVDKAMQDLERIGGQPVDYQVNGKSWQRRLANRQRRRDLREEKNSTIIKKGSVLSGTLTGAAVGVGGGMGANWLSSRPITNPLIPAITGAIGGLTGYVSSKKKQRREDVKTNRQQNLIEDMASGSKIKPGVYVVERNCFGNSPFLNNIPYFGEKAKHSFITAIFDAPVAGLKTEKLPNGQYMASFAGYTEVNKNKSTPELYKNLYVAVNGHTGKASANTKNDYKSISDYIQPGSVPDWDSGTKMYKVMDAGPNTIASVKQLQELMRARKGKSFGSYSLNTDVDNNLGCCNTVTASLLNKLNISKRELPWQIGGFGGVKTRELKNYADFVS